jgi:hypothetical protein
MKIRPLGIFERMALRTESVHPFNVVVVLNFREGPQMPVVRRALDFLQSRHPILRAGIGRHQRSPFFFHSSSPIPIVRERRIDSLHWQDIAARALNSGLDLSGPLLKCTFVEGSARECDLVFSFHHAVMDAVSVTALTKDFLATVQGLAMGETMVAPNLYPFPEPPEKRFPENFRGLPGFLRTGQYVMSQAWLEIQYRLQNGRDRRRESSLESNCAVFSRRLERIETERLVRKVRSSGLTINSLLNAAQLMAVCAWMQQGRSPRARTLTFVDLRPRLTPPLPDSQVVSALSLMRLEVDVSLSDGIWENAARVHQAISHGLKRGDVFASYMLAEKLVAMTARLGVIRLGHSALSYTGPLDLGQNYGPFRLGGVHGFISNNALGPVFASQCRLFEGRLCFDFVYLDDDMDADEAGSIADSFLASLTEG